MIMKPMVLRFNERRATEAAARFLKLRGNRMSYLKLIKLLYLLDRHIPYFAFRQAVPGKATGAHIHIGPMSTRFKLGG